MVSSTIKHLFLQTPFVSIQHQYFFLSGMLVYQVPGYYNSQLRNQAYQTMLVHYSQNPYAGRGVGEAGTSAFASGDTIAAGSLLKGKKKKRCTRNI